MFKIKELRLEKKISQKDFSSQIGIDNSQLSKIEQGKLMPTLSQLMEISSIFNVSLDWLTGKDSMLKNEHVSEAQPASLHQGGIPLVNVTAIGGYGNSVFAFEERDVKEYYVIPKFKHKKVDFMIEVEGSSMYPKYNSGDVVACRIIKERNFIQWNKTHVIATREQGIIIKRIKPSEEPNSLLMISDNNSYDPFLVPEDEIEGLAIVVGVVRLE